MAWLAPWDLGCVIFDEYLFRPGGQPGLTECLGAASVVAAAEDLMSLVEGLLEDFWADDAAGRMAIARICTMTRKRGSAKEQKKLESGGARRKERQWELQTSAAFRLTLFLFLLLFSTPLSSQPRPPPPFSSRCAPLLSRSPLPAVAVTCEKPRAGPTSPPLISCRSPLREQQSLKTKDDDDDDGRSLARLCPLLLLSLPLLRGCGKALLAVSCVRLAGTAQGLR